MPPGCHQNYGNRPSWSALEASGAIALSARPKAEASPESAATHPSPPYRFATNAPQAEKGQSGQWRIPADSRGFQRVANLWQKPTRSIFMEKILPLTY